jgi:nuclear transport factor 2 (NTF2) superfamily protein
VDNDQLADFAQKYTIAWCSRDPYRVAAFFAEDGTITVNGAPSVGRAAIAEMVQGFMTAFPDMELTMDSFEPGQQGGTYRWTFVGTNTGPDGTGKPVRFSGYEQWTIGGAGLIERSSGHFDSDEYRRQLEHGYP